MRLSKLNLPFIYHRQLIFFRAAKLEELAGYKIAIEASWYLQNLLDTPPAKEPLLSALGGLPFWLKAEIEEDLDQWKKYNVTPLFIFDGLSIVGKEEMVLRTAKDGARRSEEAWGLYNVAKTPEQTKDAVTAFGNSGMPVGNLTQSSGFLTNDLKGQFRREISIDSFKRFSMSEV